MLEKLIIRNFQKHRRLEIDFDRITTITGDNSSGKTAILRALWWLCSNRPSGTSFIRHGAKLCKATLDLDGRSIERRRGRRNIYRLAQKNYKAFGNGVPSEILNLLNVSELNYQRQLLPHLWFSLSPGNIARELNSIVDFSLIDNSQAYIASQLRQEKAILQVTEKRLKDVRETKRGLKFVPRMDRDLRRIERIESNHSQTQENASRIDRIISDVESHMERKGLRIHQSLALRDVLEKGRISLIAKDRREPLEILISKIEKKQRVLKEVREAREVVEQKLGKVTKCPVCKQPLSR